MTEQALMRGIELKQLMDALGRKQKELEEMKAICHENMDIAEKNALKFGLSANTTNGTRTGFVIVSPRAAYTAVCEDIEDIKKEMAELRKKLFDL